MQIKKTRNNSIKTLIKMALAEDLGSGDITTDSIVDRKKVVTAEFRAKEDGIIAGFPMAQMVFEVLDKKVKLSAKVSDGHKVKKGQVFATITGPAHSVLKGERLALNFLQRMSGIATLTSKYVEAVKGTNAKILDTRKTTPLWRKAEKQAVLAGGGENHRFGLYDAVLIKDNHIKFAGGIDFAIAKVKSKKKKVSFVEVEAKNLEEVRKAIEAGIDRILLDNMNLHDLKEAVKICKKYHVSTEASGNVSLDNVRKIAQTGANFISVGALTHSAKALDISLKIV
ncbi:nicotinate-nucleotide diphosphorylase (carboxylating) [candidate division WOR-1 bacterium RIFOXYC2_FULL_37_10]|uniref:Probable nicotinate-nucleotide pyrophosphorylase [carboxylating] n=1 Tax=candidate division WOR-1 bacterium RIFOXYB2_FULL_37_13 TaxID=1802579 RepID=A0A1F4SSU9_UNCSA|nr:MAG: nicotinate-nucleotide diphosphorylase (carboxylating) [candidate division WOR-1 bacterium RIFOXYA2_FULL_37_7]OGC23534.1 MAG: nicotinate-nucleotide diphosphorylase (carboxylating) [candidate division WOR-1 bacterium RIFOXYB2_FULL_37_13]OGC35747.1 MAG: nicotinate-nucleotide diphosphorylase (carboxylating) [candidate division WOR-1 bacterium RIFOXYC2_FULL_37_10]